MLHRQIFAQTQRRVVNDLAGLLREHHDEVARFMAAMQPEGAAQASQLSGLSLQAGLALAMQRRQFSE